MLLFFLIYNIKAIQGFFSGLVTVLTPFIIGAVIAYLLSPLYNMLLRNFEDAFQRKLGPRRARSVGVALSVTISILFALVLLGGLFALVLPNLINSIMGIVSSFPTYIQHGNELLAKLWKDNPSLAQTAQEIYDSVASYLDEWATKDLIPNIKNLSNTLGGLNTLVSSVFNGVVYAVKIVTNTLLGFIVAIYLLVSKTQMIGHAKQLIYSLFSIKVANDILVRCRYIHKVFSGFIRGKLLDSFIIGIICFVGTSLLNIPFAILISVVVGVTNIIPFFGPLIGAIPCAVLVLFYSPIKCIYFVIFVFALQQFDGNILGPKILGDSTGISSFGVLFAIIFFGGIFGFVGMLIGVPLFAVISSLIGGLVQGRLSKKKMSIDSEDYNNLAKVSEKPDGFSYEKMKDPTHK